MQTSIQQLLQAGSNQLVLIADNPQLEAEVLLAHVLHQPRSYLYAWSDNHLSDDQIKQYTEYLHRRCNNEPIAYIIGIREFWSLDFFVTPDTLIPRPETELLVESVLDIYQDKLKPVKLADLGTGSGAIGLALAHDCPIWQIYVTDASQNALQVARKNAQRLALKNVYFYQGNWCAALPDGNFDVIVSNPPYLGETEWEKYAAGLEFEPRSALVSSIDGLDAIRTISYSAKLYLKSKGYLLVEHGFLQGAAVRKIFAASGYNQIHSVRDLSGQERVTIGQYYP
ncbi:MAG: peptide chain release factor N(5)-glutamine methyltransferase [Gammaproteobacteria bacterium]|nr:peptide chain release factor N(5)-glutamine methyltransferase [Gammaproteobacteria bacterium]MCW5582562.1 peptide chain release factor N(5)-glutamine methyltransferase [Gammaproteobacteria bacterium]